MGMKLPPDELALYQGIDEILWRDWDPIGVCDYAPRDEYYDYLPYVFELALKNASPLEIAAYLHEVITERMELSSSVDQQLRVAEKICALKQSLLPNIL